MSFFKPEDFEGWPHEREQIANLANAKLEREARNVFLNLSREGILLDITGFNRKQSHKALLINIEPIDKCKHPQEKVEALTLNSQPYVYRCKCGVLVEPESFKEIIK